MQEPPKLHSSEEEYYTKSHVTESEDEGSWEDPYGKLPLADDETEVEGFKYHAKE